MAVFRQQSVADGQAQREEYQGRTDRQTEAKYKRKGEKKGQGKKKWKLEREKKVNMNKSP